MTTREVLEAAEGLEDYPQGEFTAGQYAESRGYTIGKAKGILTSQVNRGNLTKRTNPAAPTTMLYRAIAAQPDAEVGDA